MTDGVVDVLAAIRTAERAAADRLDAAHSEAERVVADAEAAARAALEAACRDAERRGALEHERIVAAASDEADRVSAGADAAIEKLRRRAEERTSAVVAEMLAIVVPDGEG